MKINLKETKIAKLSFKVALVLTALVMAAVVPMQVMNKPVLADQYDTKIAALQADIAQYQAESERLSQEAITLQSTLNQLSAQKSAIQAEIDVSQAKYDQLTQQITETEKKIQDNKDALGVTMADMYVDGKITPLEMLASSKNIGDYLDKQEYQSSISDQLSTTIAEIKQLKETLVSQKAEVESVLADQKQQKESLAAKASEQQALLDETHGSEAAYQDLISDRLSDIEAARAEQAAMRNRGNSTGGYSIVDGGLRSDYITDNSFGMWTDYNCKMGGYVAGYGYLAYASNGGIDGNGSDGRGYGCRQCASYVAWRIYKETGIYYSWGDAQNFDDYARSIYGSGDNQPRAGSVAVMHFGSFGHVAWVEKGPYVNSDGKTVILVSQYNWDYGQGYGMYSEMELSPGAFDSYVQVVK